MTPEDLIEEAAKAIHQSYPVSFRNFEDLDDISKEDLRVVARAAASIFIEACAKEAEANAHSECEVAEQVARAIRALAPVKEG